MSQLPTTRNTPAGLGAVSVLLGVIGLLLFLLPVLGLPISACGLLLGIAASITACGSGGLRLRWGLMGLSLSALALGVNLAVAFAPGGYLPAPGVTPPWQGVPDRPSVPPPARAFSSLYS